MRRNTPQALPSTDEEEKPQPQPRDPVSTVPFSLRPSRPWLIILGLWKIDVASNFQWNWNGLNVEYSDTRFGTGL